MKRNIPQNGSCTVCWFVVGWFCLFPSWRNNIPIKFFSFYCVGRCRNSCFHYYLFSIPYAHQSRQMSWMSCGHKICVCYFRFFNFVIYYNYEKFGICKGIQFWSDKCVFKSCCFFASNLSWTKQFANSCLYMWQTMFFEGFVGQLQIIKSIFCSIDLGRRKSGIQYAFLMVQAYVAWHWISYLKILRMRRKVWG